MIEVHLHWALFNTWVFTKDQKNHNFFCDFVKSADGWISTKWWWNKTKSLFSCTNYSNFYSGMLRYASSVELHSPRISSVVSPVSALVNSSFGSGRYNNRNSESSTGPYFCLSIVIFFVFTFCVQINVKIVTKTTNSIKWLVIFPILIIEIFLILIIYIF